MFTTPNRKKPTPVVFAVLSLIGVCVLGVRAQDGAAGRPASSASRVELIRTIIQDYFKAHDLDTRLLTVRTAVMDQLYEQAPDLPQGRPAKAPVTDDDCRRRAEKVVKEVVAKRFEPLDEEDLRKKAAEEYPIYQVGDVVTVRYQNNPLRPSKVTDVYHDRSGSGIKVGRFAILIRDMQAVEDNEKEILKFDPAKSNALREEYVKQIRDAYTERLNAYAKAVMKVAYDRELTAAAAANEALGYIRHDGDWTPAADVVSEIIGSELDRIKRQRAIAARKRMAVIQERTDRLIAAHQTVAAVAPGLVGEDVLAVAATAREVAEAPPVVAEAPSETPAEATPVEPEGELAAPQEEMVVEEPVPEGPPEGAEASAVPAESDSGDAAFIPWWAWVALGVLLVGGGCFFFFWSKGGQNSTNKFFKAKGNMEKDFWAAAELDPDNFKYVAYRYPGIQHAQRALLQLSYISEAPSGELTCADDIEYGFYPHEDKVVVYVGGPNLHYAHWREASAVFPEFPEAEYFRVSTAPAVKVDIPEVDSVSGAKNLGVEHVDVREGTGTDFSTYHIFRAPSKRNALEFLKQASVSETGVHVLVETPEGTWGKDENGIYQE